MVTKNNCRIVYIMRSLAHFAYHESTLNELVKNGAKVQLLFDPVWSKERKSDYVDRWLIQAEQPKWAWLKPRQDRWRKIIFSLRELRSYASYLRRTNQSEFYLKRWEGYLTKKQKALLKGSFTGPAFRILLKMRIYDSFSALLERLIPPSEVIIEHLREIAPDVAVISPVDMRFSEEIEYVKAARKLRIQCVLPVLSWDNLTTKGLIHVMPDVILAWNEAHMNEAISIHKAKPEQVVITGSPFFDKWFGRNLVDKGRIKQFYENVGLPENTPFLTYLGSSANIAKDESWLIQQLSEQLKNSKLNEIKIIIRPHPANSNQYEKILNEQIAMWPRPPFSYQHGVPESENDLSDFEIAMRKSIACIGINTSAMLESIILDVPTLGIVTEEYRKTQSEANHFQHLLKEGVLECVGSMEQAVEIIGNLIQGIDHKKDLRKKFVQRYVRPCGVTNSAGATQCRAILNCFPDV